MAPPIDYNIVKYLNPAESVYDKFDEQAKIQAALEESALSSEYKRIQMDKLRKDIANQAELEQAMRDASSSPNGQVDLSSALRRAATIKAQQGDISGSAAILKALEPANPYEAQKRELDLALAKRRLQILNEPKKDKPESDVLMREKTTGIIKAVPRSQLEDYSSRGWDLASSREDPLAALLQGGSPQTPDSSPPQGAPAQRKFTVQELTQAGYKKNPDGTWSK